MVGKLLGTSLSSNPHPLFLQVVDAFSKWAGPCEPMQPILKRYRNEFGEDVGFLQVGYPFFNSASIYPLYSYLI